MQRCGICNAISEFLAKSFTCIRGRRDSSSSSDCESYYRELGDQDTLKIEDRFSFSDDSDLDMVREVEILVTKAIVTNIIRPEHIMRCTGQFMSFHKRRKRPLLTRSLCHETLYIDDLYLGQVQCILKQCVKWRFNAFALENFSGGRALPVLCVHLFDVYGLITYFKLDAVKLWKLFSLLESGYHNTNPYHNSVHAADVTQAMHCFLQQDKILSYMEPLEIMASLLGAIAHDMDHPGVSQPFLVATSNYLATLYKNSSVLENHHWRTAISCLIESGVVESPDLRMELQHQISSLIMATDITRQQEFLSRFKFYLDTNTLDLTKKDHRHLVLQIALKCADISNPCRPWDISRMWSLKVCEEFFRQGDYERCLNLPITALCDRQTTSIPSIQTGFFKFVVTPLMTEWHRFLQNDLSTQMLENLKFNQKQWETMLEEELKKGVKTVLLETDPIEDYLESCSGTDVSESSELLLPMRRSSLNQNKPTGLKQQLRRLSGPLNLFQDSLFRPKDKYHTSSSPPTYRDAATSPLGSYHSMHSLFHEYGLFKHMDAEELTSARKLLPRTSITSITTPTQASRLRTVIKNGAAWKLVRQQTFPPLDSSRGTSRLCRPLCVSNDETIFTRRSKTNVLETEKKKRKVKKKTDDVENEDVLNKVYESIDICPLHKRNLHILLAKSAMRRDSLPVGTQLRDNLSNVKLNTTDQMRRRKSMPAETVPYTQKEKKLREVTAALPELLRRTFSVKDNWSRRRGSAPAPVAPSEFKGLSTLSALRHSVNGGCRKQSPLITCQQWLTKNVQERPFQYETPRRGSLPVEVYRHTETTKSNEY